MLNIVFLSHTFLLFHFFLFYPISYFTGYFPPSPKVLLAMSLSTIPVSFKHWCGCSYAAQDPGRCLYSCSLMQ